MRPLNLVKSGLFAGLIILAAGLILSPGPAAADAGDAWLGVSLQDLDRDLRDALELSADTRGIVINSVIDRSPADDAGLRSNDIITAVDGRSVADFGDLTDILEDREPGDTVSIDVIRGDRERSFSVRLGDQDDAPDRMFGGSFTGDDGHHFVLDLNDLKDGDWRELLNDDDIDVDVDEDDGHIEIILNGDDGDDDRRIIILGDDNEDMHPREHERMERDRDHNRFFWHRDDDEDDNGDDRDHHFFSWHSDPNDNMPAPPRAPRAPHAPRWVERADHAAYLGVSTSSMGEQLAAYFGTSENEGVLIEEVVDDSPAQKAGFRAGDVILRVDGEAIESPGDLFREIRDHDAGDEVNIDILRDKKKRTMTVTLAEAEDFGMVAPDVWDVRPMHRMGRELHAELAPRLHAMGPKLHTLGEELHEMVPEIKLHHLKMDEASKLEMKRALHEARRALRDAHRELQNQNRTLREFRFKDSRDF